MNMLFALRTIQERTGKDLGATFLSGTTISNSLTELYLLFKYLRPQELEKQNINSFDSWAAIFAKKTTDYEFSVTNQIVQKERFSDLMEYERVKNIYILRADMLGNAKPNMKILHPLPRVNEIAYDVDNDPHAYYIQQAGNGLYARQAIFCDVLGISLDEVRNDKTIIN